MPGGDVFVKEASFLLGSCSRGRTGPWESRPETGSWRVPTLSCPPQNPLLLLGAQGPFRRKTDVLNLWGCASWCLFEELN